MFLDITLWGNTLWQYAFFLISIIASIFIAKAFYWVSTKVIKVFTKKTQTRLDDLLIQVLEKPILFIIILSGLRLGFSQLSVSPSFDSTANSIFKVLYLLNTSWIIINFLDAIILNYITPVVSKTKSELDDHLVPILRRLIKAVIWLIILIMIIKNFGFDVSALLTGVGLGGLAFALAAQDLLSNLFGGIAILSDKPFKIGDRIRVGQNEGWVKEIGLRTTRITTLDGTELIIPNSDIAKTVLENISREKARKIRLNLSLVYSTPRKKLVEAERILRNIVKKNKSTDDDCVVSFADFGESGLNIVLIYWIKDVKRVLETKHEINMEIKERFEKAGIEFAFPTRTLYLEETTSKKKKRR